MRNNKYNYMYLFVMFDLPTTSKKERKEASTFRKMLLSSGFLMFQYSIYIRLVRTNEQSKFFIKNTKKACPDGGSVCFLSVTAMQFSKIITVINKVSDESFTSSIKESFSQLSLF